MSKHDERLIEAVARVLAENVEPEARRKNEWRHHVDTARAVLAAINLEKEKEHDRSRMAGR